MKYFGNINKKNINGKEYYYHQYRENGKMITNVISPIEAYDLSFKIRCDNEDITDFDKHVFHFKLYYGGSLYDAVNHNQYQNKRYAFASLMDYLNNDVFGKTYILYGLRRTGKTTLMFQSISSLSFKEFSKAVYIHINEKKSFYDLMDDLDYLVKCGFKYIYIDEITLLDDFISMSSVLSDFYGLRSKIVLSGTDSLGFMISKYNELYDRTILTHTTYISFKEFSEVLEIDSIDKYIEYGGVMSISGFNYNTHNSMGYNEYVDSAIAHNITHSLRLYNDGDHFSSLRQLYEKGELVNAINRIVEDTNHRFAISTFENTFKSHDYGSLKQLIKKDLDDHVRHSLDDVDEEYVLKTLMSALEIINKDYATIRYDEAIVKEIESYLDILDIVKSVDEVNASSWEVRKKPLVIQPGLRYAQAKELLDILMNEPSINKLPASIKNIISNKLLSDIKGRMLEEIVLYQSSLANKNTFKLIFPIGEYDMVSYDNEEQCSSIYEIKYSEVVDDKQTHYLTDSNKNDIVEQAYYPIKERIVLYRGENKKIDNIVYYNVNEYLKSL